MAVDDDAASASAAGSRKRPAVDGQEVAADPAGDSAASRSSSSSTAAPGTRPKQPRVASTHAGGARTAAAPALRDVQQQLVTHLLLLGSDAPGVHQLAVLLQSGALLFYDLGLYCVPGAAWHPDACCVGLGHTGRISCTAEVAFRCPQRHLVVAGGDGPPGSHSLSRPVNWSFSEHSAGSSRPAGEAPACQQQQQQAQDHRTLLDGSSSSSGQAGCVLTAADALAPVTGCSARPAQGGSVPLLLTGGRDGGVRAWDLRLGSLGAPWMAVHPHTAPVEALVLPPVGACLPWSCCVLSVCTTGRVALSCLATGTIKATFGGWSLGPPAQLAWSSGRGLIAAGGWDAAGLWHVAVWDAYSGQLDRQLSGGAAHMLMASLAQELTSSMRHLHRVQGQAATSADGSGAISSGSAWHPVPGEPQQDGSASRSSIDASGSLSGQAPRIQLVTHSAGALSVLQSQQPDVLLLDVDVARLAAELEAHSQQQRRQLASRQHLQQQLGGALGPSLRASSFDTDSLVGTPSLRSSRANSLDLSSPWAGGQATADSSSAPGQAAAQQPPLQQQLQQQQGHIGRQRLRLRGRLPQPPAVAAALQALCLLHRWGVEPHVDEQVLQLLLEQGWGSACVPDAAAGSPRPAALPSFAAAAAAAGSGNRAAASELLQLLGPLLQDPAPGSPLLSHAAPCLSQDVLLSGSGAAAVSLPSVPRTPASLGMLLPAAPTLLSSRLLALVAVSKWLMAALSSSQLAAQACSALMAESALHVPELLAASATASEASSFNHAASSNSPRRAPPHASTQPDLLLLASVTLTHPGLLTEAAQVLLAALLRPAAPGSFAVPSALPQAPQQQQQLQQVFTSPGAAAAASCWPPAVLQFALLHHLQQQQPVLGLQQLPLWMPQLVLAAAAAATRPAEVPPELLAAVGAALLDVLLGTAPAASSCIAASWLCRVLRSGFWAVWRPFVDTPAHLMRRLAHLVDRLQAANTDSRSAAAALINQSLSGLLPPGSPPSSGGGTATAAVPAGTSSTGSSSASDFRLLAQQPAAIADPHGSMGRAGSAAQPRRHVEGGLFISAALLGSAGLQGSLSSAASPAAGAAASASASAAAHQQQQHAGGIVSGPALAPVGPSQQAAGSGGTAAVVHVSRRALVVWLRSALDVLAALTLVDPAALLMELSHRLAAPGAEASSSSLGLMFSAIGRVLRRPADRALLLPHLGFAAALAVQALDPSRPALRHATLQPVMALVRDLAASFRQVDVHQGSLQLAVGSTRDLAGGQQGQQHGAPGGVGSGQPPPLVHAPTVAVFDMNGGQRKKVLLLPVLLCQQQQQQQQQASGARQHHASGPFGSAGSLASSSSEGTAVAAAAITAHLPNGISPLWSAAEGVSGPPQGPEQPHARPWSSGDGGGGSSSSLSTSAPSATAAADDAKLQRGELASSTMTRAEAAMVEHWFGGRDAAAADDAPGRHSAAGGSSGGGGGPSLLLQGGVWYTDAATANSAVLAAGDVGGGVAAVAFSPAGDAVAALVLPGHCLVAWRLAASWTQKLATFGTSLPVSQLPAVYIRIPAAATLVSSAFRQQQQQPAGGDGTSGSSSEGDGSREVLQWQLRWQTSTHVDLLHQGYLCGSLEVRL